MRTLTGLARLVRLVLRRDRVRIPVWIVSLCGVIIASATSVRALHPDQRSIDDYARFFGGNPALIAFGGPGHGFDDPNLGVILVNETQLWACVGVALMSIFLVNRHTRAEEDVERTEVLRSGRVGRHAPTAAAVTVAIGANLLVATVCALGFVLLGYSPLGSTVLAGSIAACGLVFATATATAAQIAGSGRATLGLASGALGTAFVLRAVGDIGENALSWFSPIGWAQGVRAFADERWWPLGLCLAAATALLASAFWLANRRDLGSGILPQRPGPTRAAPRLTGPLGLAVRLQQGTVIAWAVGLFLVGVVYGSIGRDIEAMIAENPAYADFLAQARGASITDSYFSTSLSMLAMLTAGFAISSALRLRSEEETGRVESVLSAPMRRNRWATSHVVVAVIGTVAVLTAAGLGIGVAYAFVVGDAGQAPRLVGAALTRVPAILVLVGVSIALFGLLPRFAPVAWAGLGLTVLVELFGEVLRLPGWARQISPLHHVPGLPAEDVRLLPLAGLVLVAVVLAGIGLAGFRARDVRAG